MKKQIGKSKSPPFLLSGALVLLSVSFLAFASSCASAKPSKAEKVISESEADAALGTLEEETEAEKKIRELEAEDTSEQALREIRRKEMEEEERRVQRQLTEDVIVREG